MNKSYIDLSYIQVAIAAALILINGGISLLLRLGLARRLLLAGTRMVAQLVLIGFVLKWIFAAKFWYTVVPLMLIMSVVAGVAAVQRSKHRYPGIWINSVISVLLSSWIMAAMALLIIVRIRPWYAPQYAIPLMGMILGNTLSGVSLSLDRLGEELTTHRYHVETLLALGATGKEAARLPITNAVRTGMIPTINVMVWAGIVSLPGTMTGQLLAGVDPLQAAKYQIVIMFLLASATTLGTIAVVLLGYRRLFNAQDQFLYWLVETPSKDSDATFLSQD
jgi:putative ABC transport system permease protein